MVHKSQSSNLLYTENGMDLDLVSRGESLKVNIRCHFMFDISVCKHDLWFLLFLFSNDCWEHFSLLDSWRCKVTLSFPQSWKTEYLCSKHINFEWKHLEDLFCFSVYFLYKKLLYCSFYETKGYESPFGRDLRIKRRFHMNI